MKCEDIIDERREEERAREEMEITEEERRKKERREEEKIVEIEKSLIEKVDEKLRETIRIVQERDDSTPVGALYLKLYDRVAAMEELEPSDVEMSDPEQVAIYKTVQVLLNKIIYTDAYLRL